VTALRRRARVLAALAGLAAVAGLAACGEVRASVVAAPPRPPAPTLAALAAVAATTTAPPVTSAPAATTTAPSPPPTTTTPPPWIATHDARLGALAANDRPVPIAVDAGITSAITGPVVAAGVDAATGELAIPADAAVVAWYQFGPAPGDAGSAVLAAHVDWHGVPGVFFRLRELAVGDPVTVSMSDGSVRSFYVVATRTVEKPELPRAEVFARTGRPTLTLVTCGGQFDSGTHHYLSNVVVTAVPDGAPS
jgi:LPXTG-site transpeptidase (sortase) family protein